MSFEIDLRSRLVGDGTVASLVGTRIYWDLRPQGSALPAVVLSLVFGSRDRTHDGTMITQDNRVQIDCHATTKAVAVSLRDAVMAVIEAPGNAGTTEFQSGFVNFFRDQAEDTPTGTVRTEQIDATIWFSEYVS